MKIFFNSRDAKILWFYILLAICFFWIVNLCEIKYWGTYIFKDPGDFSTYMKRTAWVDNGGLPYQDVFQEYPQIAALFIAIPRFMCRITKVKFFSFWFYLLILSVSIAFMAAAYYFWPSKKSRLVLMFLPATIFYSFSRYDLFPALLTLLYLSFLLKEKPDRFPVQSACGRINSINQQQRKTPLLKKWLSGFRLMTCDLLDTKKRGLTISAVILALSIFTKWYALVTLLPILVFIKIRYNTKQALRYLALVSLIVGSATIISIIVFGWKGFWATYQFHFSRGHNFVSLFYLSHFLADVHFYPCKMGRFPFTYTFFTLLQFSALLFLLRIKPKTDQQLIAFCGLSVGIFTLFTKFHSPQWIIWLLPFVYLTDDWKIVAGYFMFDLATYYHIPITDNLFGIASLKAFWASGYKFMFLIILIGLFIRRLYLEKDKKGALRGIRVYETIHSI